MDVQGDTPESNAKRAAAAQPDHPVSHKLLDLFKNHRATAHKRRSHKYKQEKADELAQLKSQHQDKIKALQAFRHAAVVTAL